MTKTRCLENALIFCGVLILGLALLAGPVAAQGQAGPTLTAGPTKTAPPVTPGAWLPDVMSGYTWLYQPGTATPYPVEP